MFNEQQFIDNPLFQKWVFNPDISIIRYWEEYLEEHPDDRKKILALKNHLAPFQIKSEKLTTEESIGLSNRILHSINISTKTKKEKGNFKMMLGYAAVGLIFFALGGLAVYLLFDKDDILKNLAVEIQQLPATLNEPSLVLSDGSQVLLKNQESNIDYTRSGEILINNDSIIKPQRGNGVINQLIIPYGNRSKVVLADNTTVWVNAGSRLLYPAEFNGNKREVVLFGEAFFDVSKDDSKPFIVKTGSLEVKVLGTQFNITAYPDDNIIQTVLTEGSVSIKRKGAHFFENDLVLQPNQLASFNKTTNESKVYDVDTEYYTIWTKGLLSFKDIDLNRITKRLERFYNTTFKYEDPLKGCIKVTGKLDLNQNQEEVMEYLAKASGISFQKVNNQHYIIE